MTARINARDWLGELRGAAEARDVEGFKKLVIAVAGVAPELREEVCRIAGFIEGGEAWASGLFKDAEKKTAEPERGFVRRIIGYQRPELKMAELKMAVKPKPEDVRIIDGRRYSWADVRIPEGVGEIEALTYVPGLVGQIVEWIVKGARRPNRVMALGTALTVVGTLQGRRVEGPTGCATHLYIFILAPTGWGKDYPLYCANRLMIAVGAEDLLGPSELVSGRGIVKYLKKRPVTLLVIDELGEVFQMINSQQANFFVADVLGNLKKFYNSWTIFHSAETMKEDSEVINHPALSIIGACTPQALFEALKPRDIESGFANRAMLFPFEGHKRPPERPVPEGAEDPPPKLIKELKELLGPRGESILKMKAEDLREDGGPPMVDRSQRAKKRWGSKAAEDAYYAFSNGFDEWQEKDKRTFELGMRATENAERCATNVAGGCFSPTVDLADIDWALKWAQVSWEAAVGGCDKYMQNYYEFPKFCEKVLEFLEQEGGFASHAVLSKKFRRNMKRGTSEFDNVISQLKREHRIRDGKRKPASGKEADGLEIWDE